MLALFLMHCAGASGGISCSGPRPGPVAIPEEEFVEMYAHLLILQQEGALSGADSAVMKVRTDSLHREFQLSRDQVETALGYYRADLPRWRELFGKIIHRLEQLQQEKPPA